MIRATQLLREAGRLRPDGYLPVSLQIVATKSCSAHDQLDRVSMPIRLVMRMKTI